LNFPEEDKVCRYLLFLNFTNQNKYSTKIIFVPSYLNENDGIFNMPYYDLLTGLDLTVFPSYYEPWGYTPLESIAFGVPTITTNLAGFGLWARSEGAEGNDLSMGVKIVERTDTSYFEVAEEIKESIIAYSELSPEETIAIREAAHELSQNADWAHFIEYYLEAYTIAFENKQKRLKI
jgi:glycosyltransferase involved in cell wall biosynthesis